MKKVKVFTTAGCPHCGEAKNYLHQQSVAFEEVDITTDQKAAATLVAKTGYTVVPQIQIGDEFVIGFDRGEIDKLLKD